MNYSKWIILADYEPGLPVIGYSELDENGYEVRKFQFFPSDSRWEFADSRTPATERTRLGDQPIAAETTAEGQNHLSANGSAQLAWRISKVEFDAALATHIGSIV